MKAELVDALEQAVTDGVIRDFKVRGTVATIWFVPRHGRAEKTHVKAAYVLAFLAAERRVRFTIHDLHTGEESAEIHPTTIESTEDGGLRFTVPREELPGRDS